jgi:hypothetical protein
MAEKVEAKANPEAARHELQLFLGQLHGVVDVSVAELEQGVPAEVSDMTREDIDAAYASAARNFGTVQAALSTGLYDSALAGVGVSGPQWVPKWKRWLTRIKTFFATTGSDASAYIARKRDTLRWGGTILKSITAAFKKEIERVPGAAAAGEALGELIDVLREATEPAPDAARKRPGGSTADS